MVKAEAEQIYECEVEREFVNLQTRARERRWVVKPVADVLGNPDAKVRCKDCHGRVRLHAQHLEHGPAPHVEHRYRQDSEYCPAGMYFRRAKDGRTVRLSQNPVL